MSVTYEIGIIVLTYNQESLLPKCLDSILAQDTLFSFKIYVVDDASTDRNRDVIQDYITRFPTKVEGLFHQTNQYQNGLSPEFPLMEKINVTFFAFCDGDDFWLTTDKLQKQAELFLRDPDLAIVHTGYKLGVVESNQLTFKSRNQRDILKAHKTMTAEDFILGNNVKKSTAMVRKSTIDFNFLSKIDGQEAQDWLLCISCAVNGGIKYLEEETTVYRVSDLASFQKKSQLERIKVKEDVRWYCATHLSDSQLRENFRSFLLKDRLRTMISHSILYRCVKPLVMSYRKISLTTRELIQILIR